MRKLELYYYPECPYCQIVLSALKETGLENSITFYNTREDSKARERHIQATGRQTVPCLYIDGKPMFESRDIADWLRKYAQEQGR